MNELDNLKDQWLSILDDAAWKWVDQNQEIFAENSDLSDLVDLIKDGFAYRLTR